MTILLSWASFEVSLYDPAADDGVDVFHVKATVGDHEVDGYFECLSEAETWDIIQCAVVCLKEMVEIEGLVI